MAGATAYSTSSGQSRDASDTSRRFGLRLGIHPSSQVLQTHERFYHPPLPPFLTPEHVQQGPVAPWALPHFLATVDPSDTLSPSAALPGLSGWSAYLAPPISRWGEEGLAS